MKRSQSIRANRVDKVNHPDKNRKPVKRSSGFMGFETVGDKLVKKETGTNRAAGVFHDPKQAL